MFYLLYTSIQVHFMKKITSRLLSTIIILFLGTHVQAQICGFSATQTSGCAPTTIILSDTSKPSNLVVNQIWNISRQGGGASIPSGVGVNYAYSFTQQGCYDVKLKVFFSNGDSCELTKPCYITINQKPTASMSFSPSVVCPGAEVTFNFNSAAGCGTLGSYQLEAMPGSILTGASATGTTQYTYQTPGTYCPFLRVSNSCGCSDDSTFAAPNCITVRNPPIINSVQSPNPTSCSSPANINFTSSVTGTNITYQWSYRPTTPPNGTWINFGTSSANSSNNFTSGQYDIKLRATDPVTGCFKDSILVGYVGVGQGAKPVIVTNVTSGCAPLTVNFSTPTSAISYNWNFPGGTPSSSSATSVSVSYPTSGVFNVSLQVGYPGGCFETETKTGYIRVSSGIAPFTIGISDSFLCRNQDTVKVSYVGPICSGCTYNWAPSFSVLLTPITSNNSPTITYLTTITKGITPIALTVTDTFGCSKTVTSAPISTRPILASFILDSTNRCAPVNINFTNTTSGSATYNSVSWSFSGGLPSSSNLFTPLPITYSSSGCYGVSLSISNQKGCSSFKQDTICIGQIQTPTSVVFSPSSSCFEAGINTITVCGPSLIDSIRLFPEEPTSIISVIKKDSVGGCTNFYYNYKDLGTFKPCWQTVSQGCRSAKICATSDSLVILGPATSFRDSFGCSSPFFAYYKNESVQADSFQWVFFDGTTSSLNNPTKLYPSCGTYPVTLFTFNRTTGCSHQKTTNTIIACPPVITAVNPIGCAPHRAIVSLNMTPYNLPYNTLNLIWNSTLGVPATPAFNGSNNIYTYNTSGVYSIMLKVFTSRGCIDTFILNNAFTVSSNNARFVTQDTAGCAPFTVNAVNNSPPIGGTITKCIWNFGDGTIDTIHCDSVNHTYAQSGIYTLRLTQLSSAGCRDSFSRQILVNNIAANFTINDSTTCTSALDSVKFTNSTTGIGTINYQWLTPGGTPASSNSTNHFTKYNTEGTFPVYLIASDPNGVCRDTIIKYVQVRNPIAGFINSNKFSNCPPLFAVFTDTSKNDICRWNWDFGNGDSSNLKNPSYFYKRPGLFVPSLTATSCNGCVNKVLGDTVKILGPIANASVTQISGCKCTEVTFSIATSNVVNLIFQSDSSKSQKIVLNINPQGTIASPRVFVFKDTFCNIGAYRPWVNLSDGPCQYTDTLNYFYIDTPNVDFRFNKQGICDTGTVCFTNTSTTNFDSVSLVSYQWDFGDGITSTDINPCHKYNTSGNFTVSLTAENSLGCSQISRKNIFIPSSPKALFTLNDSSGCVNGNLRLWGNAIPNDSTFISTWDWKIPAPASAPNSYNTQNVNKTMAPGTYQVTLTVTDTFGCLDTAFKQVIVRALPNANAGADSIICYGDSLQLNASGGVSYAWTSIAYISDTSVSNPFVKPTNFSQYVVEVTDAFNCRAKDTVVINVSQISANFVADTVCLLDSTHFRSLATTTNATMVSYQWDFDDATSGNGITSSHLYLTPQIYNVKHTVTNSLGCKADSTHLVYVSPIPLANFGYRDTCAGATVTFSDSSLAGFGNVVKWRWSFGDNTVDTINQNPKHTYLTAGTYNVKLQVYNLAGCSDTVRKTITIFSNPTASFILDSVCLGLPTSFVNTSNAGSGAIDFSFWDFNFPSPNQDTSSVSPNTTFTFGGAGAHDVNLFVRDVNGCISSITKSTFVFTPPTSLFTFANTCVGQTTDFTNQSTAGTSPITLNSWLFDAAPVIVNSTNTSRPFSTIGTHPVGLLVVDSKGCRDTSIQQVEIFDVPKAGIVISDTAFCEGEQITITDASTDGVSSPIAQQIWDMESDGITDYNTANFSHTYNSNGTYTLLHIVVDGNQCRDTMLKKVKVFNKPSASFVYDLKCINQTSVFTSTSSLGDAAITQVTWGFPGPVSSTTNPTNFVFTSPGVTQITLEIEDANGCKDQVSSTVNIDVAPSVSIEPSDTTLCLGQTASMSLQGVFSSVSWSPRNWLDKPDSSVVVTSPLNTIRYIVTANNGTCAPAYDTVLVTVVQPIPIELSATPNQIFIGLNSDLLAKYAGIIDSIVWSPDSTLSCRTCKTPVASPSVTTTYRATIYYSKNGITCSNESEITINVVQTCGDEIVFIPNTFTPNGDGFNDVFRIRGNAINRINYFRVYDRWGKLVFEVENESPNATKAHWDGTLNNGGKELNPDVFVYSYEIQCTNGQNFSGKGNVTLLR